MKKTLKIIKIGTGILLCSVVLYFIIPIAVDIYTSLQNYNKRIASRPDYTEITTPLPRDVIDDICSKFEIDPNDTRCLPGAVSYGPDFFEDMKSYFSGLPPQDQTFATVEQKLGPYLISCEKPNNEGKYSCTYDLRGDGIYRIGVFFTKDDFYYRVIASTGSS
jgi:hypothetical protein